MEFFKPFCKLTTKGISNLPLSQSQETQNSQMDDSQLTETQSDMETQEQDVQDENLLEPDSLQNTADNDIHVLINSNRQEEPTPRTPPSNTVSSAQPSTPSASRVGPPDFARLDRKRKATGDSPLYSILADMAGSFKQKMEKKKEKASTSENEKFCMYPSSQLDRLGPLRQMRVRKRIQDIVYEEIMEQFENTENTDQ